jgi:hypothetical protein
MAEHEIHGKKVQEGQMVTYTDANGSKHKAVVKQIRAVYHGDLQARIDGADRFVENVPFGAEGGAHSWGHMPEDEHNEMVKGNVDESKDAKASQAKDNKRS